MKKRWTPTTLLMFSLLAGFVLTACAPLISQPITAASPSPVSSSTPTISPTPVKSLTPVSQTAAQTLQIPDSTQLPNNDAKPTAKPGAFSTPAAVLGEAPSQVLDVILKDLEGRIGSKPETVKTIRSEFITWNDGSMGCPKRGVFYTMATIEGYWVVLQVNSRQYDYRIAARGTPLVLCEP